MKTRDIFPVLVWAAASFALTMAAFWPGLLNAVDSGAVKPDATHPTIAADGVELTLCVTGQAALKAGDQPTLEINAVNTTDETVSVEVNLRMTAVQPTSERSRMLPMPTEVWKDKRTIEIKPNKSVAVNIPTGTKLPADKSVQVTMAAQKKAVTLPLIKAQWKPKDVVVVKKSSAKAATQPVASKEPAVNAQVAKASVARQAK